MKNKLAETELKECIKENIEHIPEHVIYIEVNGKLTYKKIIIKNGHCKI